MFFIISRSSSQQAAEERHESRSKSRSKGDQHMLPWTVLCFLKFFGLLFHVGRKFSCGSGGGGNDITISLTTSIRSPATVSMPSMRQQLKKMQKSRQTEQSHKRLSQAIQSISSDIPAWNDCRIQGKKQTSTGRDMPDWVK
ncbi:uncharacterized protein LOC134198286 isoform X1 [Corticium candelabrum]|uniref:uncharacterized protein LOC134198286 isoform X1 n=1 Tax=Corticium candelabrum TaxID=121492 RepID=UPI002E2683D1|nr:uncharacterized protein LOC134198286 isoform X1 [Corticium candelabrum]